MENRYRQDRNGLNIRVYNKETKTTWEHRNVPKNHVGMIDLNPILEVEVLPHRRRSNRRIANESAN